VGTSNDRKSRKTGERLKGATKSVWEIGHWRSFMSGAQIISLPTYIREIILS
jgi:hypothetical protein